ncbi:hypothetical protein [Haemophilus parahaemolyticus]|jgi:hypothetical protein
MNIHFLNSFYLAEDKLIQQNIENIILNEFLMGSDVYSLFPEERYTQYFCYDNELIAVVFFKIKDTACYHVTVHKTYSFKENDYLKIKVCELLGACVVDLSEFIVGGGVKLDRNKVLNNLHLFDDIAKECKEQIANEICSVGESGLEDHWFTLKTNNGSGYAVNIFNSFYGAKENQCSIHIHPIINDEIDYSISPGCGLYHLIETEQS